MNRLSFGLALLLLISPCSRAQAVAVDSIALREAQVFAMSDSIALGIRQLGEVWRRQERQQTDSLKYRVQSGLGRVWKEWAIQTAPRPGMSGEHWLQLADLFSLLDHFDMQESYDRQLSCYKWAMQYKGMEERALQLLHTEYSRAGFAPGMIQTGEHLLELNKKRAMDQGVARTIAMAYYLVGDRAKAKMWIGRHLRVHPDDEDGRELRKRVRRMGKD